MNKVIVYLLLILIIGLSAINKIQNISNDLAPANIAHLYSLITLDNWNKQSPHTCFYISRLTYDKAGDKNMEYYPRLLDKNGNNYYISHPPFSMIFHYYLIKFFHLEISQASLQWIHLFLFLIEILIIFLLVKLLLEKKRYKMELALLGALFYAAIPVVNYMHTFHCFSESLGQTLFLLSIYTIIRYYYNSRKTIDLIFVFISLFLFVYTDWLGIFLFLSLILLMFLRRQYYSSKLFIIIISSVGLSLSLTLFQYIHIASLYELLHSLGIRFIERSGWFASKLTDQGKNIISISSYKNLIILFWKLITGVGSIVFVLWIILKIKSVNTRIKLLFLCLFLLPAVLSVLVFFNAMVLHYIYWARFSLFLSLITVIFVQRLLYLNKININIILLIVFIVGIFWSILSFDKQNKISNDDKDKIVAIIKNVKPNEAIFINSNIIKEINIYYYIYKSKRNIRLSDNKEKVIEYCKLKKIEKAVFITNNKNSVLNE